MEQSVTISLESILSLLQNLSDDNKKWIADRLYDDVYAKKFAHHSNTSRQCAMTEKHASTAEQNLEAEKRFERMMSIRDKIKEPVKLDIKEEYRRYLEENYDPTI